MKIAVVGTGYVGLVTGACLAEFGHHVTCVDNDLKKLDLLRAGEIPFFEPGLKDIVLANQREKRLAFSENLPAAAREAQALFIAVGTPSAKEGHADIGGVEAVAREIAPHLLPHAMVIVKSTVPVGTTFKVKRWIEEQREREGASPLAFYAASNPEFLREGTAVKDFMEPERVVAGISVFGEHACTDAGDGEEQALERERAKQVLRRIYSFLTEEKLIFMDVLSSEMTKYATNAMLATRISFMNEVASICERVGADVEKVRIGMGSDSRIGNKFLMPGCGYGGSCFPKDIRALDMFASETGYRPLLIQAVEAVNRQQKELLHKKLGEHLGSLAGKKIAVWGLSFKPGTSDVREAPSHVLIASLLEDGASVAAHDPQAVEETKKVFGETRDGLVYFDDPYEALTGADALAICTEWSEYRNPDFERMRGRLKNALVVDGRNLYDPQELCALGFVYDSVGRPRPQKA